VVGRSTDIAFLGSPVNGELKLAAVGDIMLGDAPICMGFGVGSVCRERGYDSLLDKCRPVFQNHDLVFGNLESVLSDLPADVTRTVFNSQVRATPAAAPALRKAGFGILSVANNHIMQHGIGAFCETMESLDKHEILHVGTKSNEDATVVTAHNIRVGFVAYSLIPVRFPDASAHYWLVEDDTTIVSSVRELRGSVDVVVVSLHWGYEFMDSPSPQQVALAHRLVDAGAHIILGHHSHVIQGIERYKKAVIAYSLGNFIFDAWQRQCRNSVILSIALSKAGVTAIDVLPVMISEYYCPRVVTGDDAQSRLEHIHKLSCQISGAASRDAGRYLKEVSKARRHYQMQAIVHLLLNTRRYPVRLFPGIIKWLLIRLYWILRLILVRDKNPYSIYTGPGT